MTMRYFQKHLLVCAAIASLLAGTGFAQEPKPASPAQPAATPLAAKPGDSADKIVENFFALLTKDQVDQAYDYLTAGTKIAERLDEVSDLKVKAREAIRIRGDIKGYELLNIQNAGTHLMRATYVSLGKSFPLRWKFYFYKGDTIWKLIDIGIDDGLANMFDENKAPEETGTAR